MLVIKVYDESAAIEAIEMYDLDRDIRLWRIVPPQPENTERPRAHEVYHQIQGDDLLMGYKDLVYLLDLQTGVLRSVLELEQEIAALTFIDEQSYQLVLENGDYLTGRIAEGALQTPEVKYSTEVSIAARVPDASEIGNVINGAPAEVYTDEKGNTTLAVVREDDLYSIELYRFMNPDGLTEWHEVVLTEGWEFFRSQNTGFTDEDTLALGKVYPQGVRSFEEPTFCECGDLIIGDEEYHDYYELIDTATYRSKGIVSICGYDELYSDETVTFLPDGSGYLRTIYDGHTTLWDAQSGEIIHRSGIDHKGKWCLMTVTPDKQMITIQTDEKSAEIWHDDSGPVTVQYPQDMKEPRRCVFSALGCNGYWVTLDVSEACPEDAAFWVCDTATGAWRRIGREYSPETGYVYDEHVSIGNTEPVFASLQSGDILRIYDCATGEKIREFQLEFPCISLKHVEFVLDDAYLMLYTWEGQIAICDAMTGEFVYRERNIPHSYYVTPEVFEDPINHRVYIIVSSDDSGYHGVCLDSRTWMKMAEIPGMIAFDERDQTIYRCVGSNDSDNKRVVAYRIPGTQEILALAQAFLAGN